MALSGCRPLSATFQRFNASATSQRAGTVVAKAGLVDCEQLKIGS